MQGSLRYVAALAILLVVGASVATVDAAPGKSITGFFAAQGNGNGGGNGNADDEETAEPAANSGNANANANASQGGANADDGADNANANAGERADNANDGAGSASLANTSAESDDENADDDNSENKGGRGSHAAQNDQASPVPTDHKEMVCHLTGSESNPVVVIVIDQHALPAHEQHGDEVVDDEEDCIPPVGSPEPTETPATPIASPTEEPTETPATPIASPIGSPVASPTET
jgi:hypothetical protein